MAATEGRHLTTLNNGGQVILTAAAVDALARAVVNNTGIVEARVIRNQGGIIRLDGGEHRTVSVSGTLDAPTVDLNATITLKSGGVLSGTASTVNVNDARIQNGVDAAASGATVNVLAGTYSEAPTITRSVTLQGDPSGSRPLIELPGGTAGTLTITASNVTVQGLQINKEDQTADAALITIPRGGSYPGYTIMRLVSNVNRLQRVTDADTLSVVFSGQLASKNLNSSEEFYLAWRIGGVQPTSEPATLNRNPRLWLQAGKQF